MALDALRVATIMETKMEHIYDDPYYTGKYCSFIKLIENELDKEFQKGKVTLENVDITTPKGSLHFDICRWEDVYRSCKEIGDKCASYWSKTIQPTGKPQSCRKITGVTNDASKIASPISTELCSLATSVRISEPFYYEFCNIILKHVKTIVWTVTESDSTCDSTFTVKIT